MLTECDIRGGLPLDTGMAMLALTAAHALQRPTFGALLAALPDRALALATLWRLIARGALHTDLSVPITFDSELAAWQRGLIGDGVTPGCGEPVSVSDPRRFLFDFLPLERRLIRRDGISLHSIHYWSDILRSWIGEPLKMIVRYDHGT